MQRGCAVDGLADHLEPLGLQHHPGTRPEGGVVVDDEDPVAHEVVNDCGPTQMCGPYGWPHSAPYGGRHGSIAISGIFRAEYGRTCDEHGRARRGARAGGPSVDATVDLQPRL